MDARGDRGRRPAAAPETRARARRRRHDHRLRPHGGPRLRRPADGADLGGADGGAVRRSRIVRAHQRIRRRYQPVAGGGAHGVRRRRRAPALGRHLRHQRLDSPVLRPGHRPVRPVTQAGRDREHLPAVGAQPAAARQRAGGPAQPRARRATPPGRGSLDGDPAVRTQTEKTEIDNGFTSLGADAELDQVIFDGSSFGTAAPAGSDEEADYLGIPGLLDAEQMRALLHRRQDEQLQRRAARGRPPRRRRRRRCMASCASCAVSSTPSCRPRITAPASRTAGFTTNFAVVAGAADRRRDPRADPGPHRGVAAAQCRALLKTASRRRAPRALRPRGRPTRPAGSARSRPSRPVRRVPAPSRRRRRPPSSRRC